MEPKSFDLYELTNDREKRLWEDCIFIFDSSALLDFYFMPKATREAIYKDILVPHKNRFWIPAHVQYEYLKNRKKIIAKPITEKYKPLRTLVLDSIKTAVKDIETKIGDLKNHIKNKDTHPFFDDKEILAYEAQLKQFKTESDVFDKAIEGHMKAAEEDINKISDNDDVLSAFEKNLAVGREFTFDEIYQITLEGKHRYEHMIPPGYEDQKDKDKKGTQIFGDLIIWKQILEYSKTAGKPIVFICNDLKEDWCYQEKKSTEKRIASPREELIKELYDASKSEFWMYNLPQFLYHANTYLDAAIAVNAIQNISTLINQRDRRGESLKFRCDNCMNVTKYDKDEVELDFECVESHERGMGPENHYQAIDHLHCHSCGKDVVAEFNIWEYPVGATNYDEVELDGAELLDVFPFEIDFFGPPEPEEERCQQCGEIYTNYRKIDICDECDEKYGTGEK